MIKTLFRSAALALLPLLALSQPISQLPTGTSPNGSEWVPAVQNDTTVKLTLSQMAEFVGASALGTPTSIVLINGTGLPLTTGVIGILPLANGGTGTATPGLIEGSGVTITGTWPNQMISASGGGSSTGTPNTWTAAQTFSNNNFLILGSGIGPTTITSANITSTPYTITVPAITDTLVTLNAPQTLTNKSIASSEITGLGTFATQNFANPPAIGGGSPNAVTTNALTDTAITGSTQCVEALPSGQFTGTGAGCANAFISGTFTSAQVIANFAPASYPGSAVLTTDMGLMACDGTRWNVVGTPPEPPGAMQFSYNHNVFTYFPVLADIGTGHTSSIGAFRIYSGYLGLNTSEPVVSTAFQTSTTPGTVGQLQLNYPSGTANAAGVFTIVPFYTAPLSQDYGQAGLALGSRGFYVEIAYTDSSNNTDCQDTLFVEPQEHNALNNDQNPAYAGTYTQRNEFDVNECGHGTDYSGAYRGAYLQWAQLFSQPITLASSYSSGATSISLASGWPYETGSTAHPWTITFNSSGETRTAPFANGSTGPYTLSSGLSSSESNAATVNTQITLVSNSLLQTSSLDYTTEHIFGGAYDPVGKTWNIWQDGVFQGSISTAGVNSNTFRDTLHYMIIVAAQSRGAHVPHTMTVRYVSMWTP